MVVMNGYPMLPHDCRLSNHGQGEEVVEEGKLKIVAWGPGCLGVWVVIGQWHILLLTMHNSSYFKA